MKTKKKSSGGGANWMDTYGDMVTLLLCFFVLLYSMSSISEENWKALVMSFNPDAQESLTQTPGGDGPNADADEGGGPIKPGEMSQGEIDEMMDKLFQQIENMVAENEAADQISFFREGGKIFISFNQAVFFDGDSPVLREESKPILKTVGEMLEGCQQAIDEIRVLGHTAQADGIHPNSPKKDRTLASQRATNVVIYLQENTILDPARLISEGIGQWRPVDTNATPEGRAKNRRVEMIISGRDLEKELPDHISQFETR